MSGFDLTTLTTNGNARRSIDKILLFNSYLKNNSDAPLYNQNLFPSLELFDKLKAAEKVKYSCLEEAIIQFQKDCIGIVNKSDKLPIIAKQQLFDALFADVTYRNDQAIVKNVAEICKYADLASLWLFIKVKMDMADNKNIIPDVLFGMVLAASMMFWAIAFATRRGNTIIHENTDCFIDWVNNLAKNIDELSELEASNDNNINVADVPEATELKRLRQSDSSICTLYTRCFDLTEDHVAAQRFVDNPGMRGSLDEILLFSKENNQFAVCNNAVDVFLDLKYNRTYQTTMRNLLDLSKIAIQNSQFPQDKKNELLDAILALQGRATLSHADLKNWIASFSADLHNLHEEYPNQWYASIPKATLA